MLPHLVTYAFAALLAVTGFAPLASAQEIDRWHYIDADSVLHSERVDGLQGAGVIQSDTIFAMLYLGLPDQNGVVTVALPMSKAVTDLTSTLVSTSGQRFERALTAEELDVVQINDTTVAYSFPISGNDVDLFKSAQTWQLAAGEMRWPVTLTGSRRAIEEAERKHKDLFESLTPAATISD